MENPSTQTQGLSPNQTQLKNQGPDPFTEKKFGPYTIVAHIGKGGMGDVYKAIQTGLERTVALKILPSLLARSLEFSDRFFSEAYAISRLQHQNIVTLYDYGEEEGQKYIAMQFVEGTTLSKIIKENKKLDYARIIHLTKQICRGLKYAHQNEIIHRDIKSGNIMVAPNDKVYIADFGIAKVIDAPSITTTGMAMGTPEYMAPEQCEGGVVDGQSDIYGLGIIIYEMVTGRPPFLADTPLAVAYKQVHEAPPLLRKKCPDAPQRLELIVAKCLKKNKSERYLNANELLRDLDSAHFEMVPEDEEKDSAPSDLRITDRRGRDRRHMDDPMAISRGYLWGLLGILGVIFVALGYLLLKPSGAFGSQGSHEQSLKWIVPISAEGGSADKNMVTAAKMESLSASQLFDGKHSTAWASMPLAGKEEAEIEFSFSGKYFLTSLVIESGLQFNEPGMPIFARPRGLQIETENHRILKFNLADTDIPQTLNLGGLVLEKGKIRFTNYTQTATNITNENNNFPLAVREVRFLGLPYE